MSGTDIKTRIRTYLLAFFIPFSVIFIAYIFEGVYPGGPLTPLYYDLRSQYFAFYSYLKQLGNDYNSIMYQTLSGLGGGYFGTFAYYTGNPLSFIVCLFPDSYLPYAMCLIAMIKIGFSGLFFSVFMINGSLKELRTLPVVLFSCCYALMSYNVVYSINPMFLDGVLILPLVILGVDLILAGRNGVLFTISVFSSILFCYYMAFMVILFSVIWFFFRVLSDRTDKKIFVSALGKCFASGFLGVLISSFVIIPVYFDLKRGRLNENVISGFSFFLRKPFDILKGFLPFSFNGFLTHDPPFIYIGTVPLIFFICFFVSGKINRLKKIYALGITFIFVLSFVFFRLDTFWTAGTVSNGYPARYSFLLCFFLLYISANWYKECSGHLLKKHLIIPAIVFSFTELIFNSFFLMKSVPGHYEGLSPYEDYIKLENVMSDFESLDSTNEMPYASRIYKFWDYSQNDGLLYGMPSLDYFSSSYNFGLHEFFGNMGLEQHYHHLKDSGLTPFTEKLLGVGYYCLYKDQPSDHLPVGHSDECSFFRSDFSGSLAFPVQRNIESPDELYGSDPFGFQNKIASDIYGYEIKVFNDCPYRILNDVYREDAGVWITSVEINVSDLSDIYFYSSPVALSGKSGDAFIYPELYYDGNLISVCQSDLSSYIISLGKGSGDIIFDIICREHVDDFEFALLDEEALDSVFSNPGFITADTVYDKDGISFNLFSEIDTNVLIMLPYEKGYKIHIDGKDVPYSDYHNALISIPVNSGDHLVRITYYPPGLKTGILISLFSVFLCFIYYIYLSKRIVSREK